MWAKENPWYLQSYMNLRKGIILEVEQAVGSGLRQSQFVNNMPVLISL